MGKKIVWLAMICLMVLSLLASSCAPTTSANPTPSTTTAPITKTTPIKSTTPATTTLPTTTTGPEMVKVSLKKLDGTTLEKLVEKPQYGGELTLIKPGAIQNWDEFYTATHVIDGNIGNVNEMLLVGDWSRGPAGTEEVSWQLNGWFNAHYSAGALAESWDMQEPETITFHIRKGVHFSLNTAFEASRLVGGRELTADDIVWNIRRMFIDAKTAPIYATAGTASPVDAYATDDSTVVVKARPGQIWMTFEYVTAWMSVYSPDVIKKYGDAQDWTRVVGTGSYTLTDYVPMSSATYEKNPNYWGKDPVFPENQLPYVDTVKLLIIPDASTRMSAMRTGKVDQLSGLEWEDAGSLQKTNPELKSSKYLGGVQTLSGREDKPELPFKDINVRRALMMAINNQEIADTYYGREAFVFSFPITPLKEWAGVYTPLDQIGLAPDGFDTKKIYGYSPEEARALLAKAGYPDGFKTEIILTTPQVDLASIIKAYWADIGVDLKLDVREAGVANSILTKKTHKEMFMQSYGNAGVGHNLAFSRSGMLYSLPMVNEPEIQERYDKQAALEPYSDQWREVLRENNLLLVHRVDALALPQPYNWVFWQPWLKGYNGEGNLNVWASQVWNRYVWIDQDLKKSMGR